MRAPALILFRASALLPTGSVALAAEPFAIVQIRYRRHAAVAPRERAATPTETPRR
jgi:hypothetical protein